MKKLGKMGVFWGRFGLQLLKTVMYISVGAKKENKFKITLSNFKRFIFIPTTV